MNSSPDTSFIITHQSYIVQKKVLHKSEKNAQKNEDDLAES